MQESVLVAVLAAIVAALGGLLAPRAIARLPEPAVDSATDLGDGTSDADDDIDAERDIDASPASPASAAEPDRATDAAPSTVAKIPYATLAARPHLGLGLALGAAALAGTVGSQHGLDPALVAWVVVAVLGATLSYIDWTTHLLPKRLVLPAYPLLLGFAALASLLDGDFDVLVRVGIGWAAVSGIYALLWFISPRGIGYGDVRLSGVIAIVLAMFGWSELIAGAYGGFVLGAVGGLVLAALRIVDRRAFPFGPFMVVGAWAGIMWGRALVTPWS